MWDGFNFLKPEHALSDDRSELVTLLVWLVKKSRF